MCGEFLEEELKKVEARFDEFKEKGARETGETFASLMGEDLKFRGLMRCVKNKKSMFPDMKEILEGYDDI